MVPKRSAHHMFTFNKNMDKDTNLSTVYRNAFGDKFYLGTNLAEYDGTGTNMAIYTGQNSDLEELHKKKKCPEKLR